MERFSLTDLNAFELKFNAMPAPVRSERPRLGRITYQRHPKPPYTYTGLIVTAIQTSQGQKLTLADIHASLGRMFPFFRDARYTGWRDSVRHNLSHHSCFQMELKDPTRKNGKGNFWKVDMTQVSADMFKKQQTSVARDGNWASDLHQQLGIPPLVSRHSSNTSTLQLPQSIPQRPVPSRKRKLEEEGSMNYVTSEPQATKRHMPFSIAHILRVPQPVTHHAEDVKPFAQWTVPRVAAVSLFQQPLTPQSSDDSGCYGSSSSATTSPGETTSRENLAKPADTAHLYAEALDLCLRDFQCPSYDGLPAFDSLSSPGTNAPIETTTSVFSPTTPTSTLELPACSMTSRQHIPSNLWATASLPLEVPTDYTPSCTEVYMPVDYWPNYYIHPAFVKPEHYESYSS